MTARILATLAAVLALAAPAPAQQVLRFSSAAPPADFLAKSMTVFKEAVEKSAPGQLTVQLHPGSVLFRQGTEIAAMQRGNLDMNTMTTFEASQQIPELGFLNRAYLFRDYDHATKVFQGPVGEEFRRKVAEVMGIQVLETTYLGTRQLNLRKAREVKGPGDLAGVKLRMPGGPEWLLLGQTLGVTPTPLGMPEVYLALKTGAIDGQENPLTITSAARFYEVTEQVVLTGHLVQPVFYAMARPVWDRLSPEQRRAVQAAATTAARWNDEARLADEKQVTDALRAKGLTITAVDPAPFRASADRVYATAELAKPWDRRLLEAAQATR
jgi:tripartite ATP-independent transporter DctP family solute receptor